MTPSISDSLRSCRMTLAWEERHTLQKAAVGFPSPLQPGAVMLGQGNWYFLSLLQSLPILFIGIYLLVSTLRKESRIKRTTRFQLSFTANIWFKGEINKRKFIKPRVWPQKRLVWFYDRMLKPGWIWFSKYTMPFPIRHLTSIICSPIKTGFWEEKLGEGNRTEMNNLNCSSQHYTST